MATPEEAEPDKHLPGLTDEQREELKAVFHYLDKDKDGYIKIKEMHSLIMDGDNMEYSEELIREADADDDGAINAEEFLACMEEKLNLHDSEAEIKEAFLVFDKEGNGFLSGTELRRIMTNLGTKLTDHQVDLMIQDADLDGDGQINYEEFVRVIFAEQEVLKGSF